MAGLGRGSPIYSASTSSNLRFLPRMHVPISYAFFPPGLHLPGALIIGITGGFCEEVLYRAFLMTEFANAGYSKAMQVLIPGLAFGFIARGLFNSGLSSLAWPHATDCVHRDDVGNCIPVGSPQLGSDNSRALYKQRDSGSLDLILYGNRSLASAFFWSQHLDVRPDESDLYRSRARETGLS
jgi:hypothetical protein